ncbi:MAG: TRAP transporter small permease subunit [Dehalococcoidia bacterium]|nr:TRAP transporter small permease subunit [Dehalococcoidia bacterium]
MKRALRTIDYLSEYVGRSVCILAIVLVLVLANETSLRYFLDRPTMWGYELSYMVGASMAVLGWSYTHKHKGHVRVDIIYSRLSLRGRAIIDVVCSVIFLAPLLYVLVRAGFNGVAFALKMNEVLAESSWLPPAWPIRTVVFVGFVLFALQCSAQFVRDVYALVRNEEYD